MQDKKSWCRWLFIVLISAVVVLGAGCRELSVSERTESMNHNLAVVTDELKMPTLEPAFDDFSIQIEDIRELLNDEVIGIVYFGHDTCPFCLTLNSIIKTELDFAENVQIYKFDTDSIIKLINSAWIIWGALLC